MSETRGRETYETQPYETTGYGQQAMETRGTEQPSMVERVERAITGKQPEYGTRETEYTGGTGAGTGTGTGSLADSMRSTYSTRPALGTKYEEPKQGVGEKIKSMLPGHTEETRGYEQGRGYGTETGYTQYGTRGYEQGQGRGYEQGRGYGQTGGQPSVMERVEATFTGRTAQEQHEHDAQQRRQREMERSRGASTEPGLMHQFMSGAQATFIGTPSKKSIGQRWKESINEIRTSLTGQPAPGEVGYTPMGRSTYSEYPTQQRTGRY